MNQHDETHEEQFEDDLIALLTDYEEHLLADSTDGALDQPPAPRQLQPRLNRACEVLQLLARQSLGDTQPALDGDTEGGPGAALVSAPPRSVGRFEIRRELGHGGCGIVFLAYDPNLRREVALKVPLTGAFITPAMRDRFLHEAWAAAGLDHANVVPVYEAGHDGIACFIASAYCKGPSLADFAHSKREPIGEQLAADLVAKIADGVQHAHDRGVLHRDLKPSNVMLDPVHGEPADTDNEFGYIPRITDFGLAKLQEEGVEQTQSGILIGTASYMAPEQAAGRKQVDARADVYALGGILYELLVGRPPFLGETQLETLEQVKNLEPVSPRRLRPSVSLDLDTISLKCLEKDPHRRYQTAALLAEDLRRFLEGRTITARPTGRWTRLLRWCARNRALSALAATVTTLGTALLLTSMLMSLWLSRERVNTLRAMGEMHVVQAKAYRQSGREGQRFNSLASIGQANQIGRTIGLGEENRLRLRNEAIEAMILTDLQLEEGLARPKVPSSVTFDPSLEFYAYSDGSGNLAVHRVDNAERIAILPCGDCNISRSMFSPDGQWLASLQLEGKTAGLKVWRWRLPEPDEVLIDDLRDATFDLSSNGLLAAVASDGSIVVHDTQTGSESRRMPVDFQAHGCCFSPDASRLAVWGGVYIQIFDVDAGAPLYVYQHPSSVRIQCMAWSPDGRLLASGSSNFQAYVWDADYSTDSARHVFAGHEAWITSISFDCHSEVLVTSGKDGETRVWDPWRGSLLTISDGQVRRIGMDGRGAVGVLADQVVRWRLAVSKELSLLRNLCIYEFASGDIRSDGSLFVSCAFDGLRLWSWPQGKQLAEASADGLSSSTFDESGTGLFTVGHEGFHRWSIRTDQATGELQLTRTGKIHPHQDEEAEIGIISDNGRVLVTKKDAEVRILQIGDPADTGTLIHQAEVFIVAVSPDGQWIATVGAPSDRIQLWNADTGRPGAALPCDAYVTGIWFDLQSRRIVSAGKGECRLWQVETGELLSRFAMPQEYGEAEQIAITPDSSLLAVATADYHINLIETETTRLIARLPAQQLDPWLSFSPDGRYLICTGTAMTIAVWDLQLVREGLRQLDLDWHDLRS